MVGSILSAVIVVSLVSIGVAVGPALRVEGTPCEVSSTLHNRHNGSMKRSVGRTRSAQ